MTNGVRSLAPYAVADLGFQNRHNFSELGRKFPLLATVVMGAFARLEVSLATFQTPFRHNLSNEDFEKLLEKEDPVIVGANVTSKDKSKQYCLVKNSYGDGWGHERFSKIALEMVL
ncbi:transducin/WD40 repeat-like superfamily protein [Tanacetum coccineum]